MLDRVLRQPARRAAEFSRYERQVGRVIDLYLKICNVVVYPGICGGFFPPAAILPAGPRGEYRTGR
jgi:hypothetical protein